MQDLGSTAFVETPAAVEPKQDVDLKTLATAELAECNCPDFCERDHDTD